MYDFLLSAKDAHKTVIQFKQSQIETEEDYEKRVQQTVEKNLKKINDSISKAAAKGETNVSFMYPNEPFINRVLFDTTDILVEKGYAVKKYPLVYGEDIPTNWRVIIDWSMPLYEDI